MHAQGGSISKHLQMEHSVKLTRKMLDDVLLDRDTDPHRLIIREALHIIQSRPKINMQEDHFGRILRVFVSGTCCLPPHQAISIPWSEAPDRNQVPHLRLRC